MVKRSRASLQGCYQARVHPGQVTFLSGLQFSSSKVKALSRIIYIGSEKSCNKEIYGFLN